MMLSEKADGKLLKWLKEQWLNDIEAQGKNMTFEEFLDNWYHGNRSAK